MNPNNTTTDVPSHLADFELRKKILLYTPSCDAGRMLARQIKQCENVVLEIANERDELIREIAQKTPHLLVIHHTDAALSLATDLVQIEQLYPELGVCLLEGDLSQSTNDWRQVLRVALFAPIPPETPREYASGTRFVLHDESFPEFRKEKLNRPKKEEGWEQICSSQEARFLHHLQTARKNHPAAKRYLECLLKQQAGLDQELAYRLAHGSYKALSWSRELIGKWIALLVHYVPDVELEYLPRAGTPGPVLDFVHRGMPMEAAYASTLLILFRPKPVIVETIKQAVTSRFEGQDDQNLFNLSLTLYGMAKLLQQVGTAQVELMDAWLDPTIVDRPPNADIPRGEHRNAGIYRDFYDLTFIVHWPEPLSAILKGFHAGTTLVQQERFLPSYVEFRRLSREAAAATKAQTRKKS